MTPDTVKALRNTHSNRYDAGFMNPHMIIVLNFYGEYGVTCPPYSPLRARSQPHESPSCLQPSATRWLFAAGRMGVCDPTNTGHSQESIGSAVVLSQGLETITGSALKQSFTIMNIIKHLNYLDVKWSSRFRYVLTVRCQIRAQNTNKWSSAILAALRPFAYTPGTLTEGYKRLPKGLHRPALPLPL